MAKEKLVGWHAKAYCEATTVHGFAYWVNAPRFVERIFWVAVVVTGFTCASLIISAAVRDWQENPGVTTIKTFSRVDLNLHVRRNVLA